ncbi:MAG: bifunctional diaminohydroxyphosphoribosylaminopyrimidine deaminase/5-amino-6-(5-phosphoribosylamino)uracil reductase RibD [Aureliella sp.]
MPNRELESDTLWMRTAIQLAQGGLGHVEPNPMVGCVLVDASGEEIGRGYHKRYGAPHAERDALANCPTNERLAGATAFVTLEPCCHHGKTPPCVDALIESGVARVVIGCLDPNPVVAGRGASLLREAGMQVEIGCLQAEAECLIAPFRKRQLHSMPWVIGKWAMTLDGKIATKEGKSKWISNEQSRATVQQLRGRVDAILVGSGTALTDDPRLVARLENVQSSNQDDGSAEPKRIALRVVADNRLRLRVDSDLVQRAREYPTVCLTSSNANSADIVRLKDAGVIVYESAPSDPKLRLLDQLRYLSTEHSVTNLLCEGGGQLLGALHDAEQLDQVELYVGPKLFGGVDSVPPLLGIGISDVNETPKWELRTLRQYDNDVHLSYVRTSSSISHQ